MEYNFREIEKKWQKRWVENKTYQVTEDETKKKFYVLNMFPYPSGAGLHVGHPLGYIASDIYARYKRLQGFNVLNPMGYDAYGLPAEQYAIQTGQHPAITTVNNINRYREQLDKIGFSFDWNREIRTCEPEYYHWTQWAFQKMFNSYYCNDEKQARPIQELIEAFSQTGTEGINVACSEELSFTAAEWNAKSEKEQQEILMNYRIAYLGETMVNWCPQLGTVLANDEVVDGVSERGGFPVIQKKMRQWCLRVSAYAQRLLDGLDTIDWTESLKETQKNWIGRSEGAEIEFKVKDSDLEFTIFTTRADTMFGVTFMVLAPESELVQQLTTDTQKDEVNAYLERTKKRTERERIADRSVTGAFSGSYAINPFTGEAVPIWISDYVLAGYGTGAIMAVPAHDSRDYAFAKHFGLEIRPLVEGCDVSEESFDAKEGIMTLDFDKDVARKLWDNYYVPFIKGYFSAGGRFRSDDMKSGSIIAYVGSSSSATFFPSQVITDDMSSHDITPTILPCPKFEDGEDYAVQQGAGMVITKATDAEIRASLIFLKWFTSPEHNIAFSVSSGYLPVTREGNSIDAIRASGLALSDDMDQVLTVATATVNDNHLYTPRAFSGGTDARAVLEYAMSDKATADRTAIDERMADGQSLAEASAEFLTDECFEARYQDTLTALLAYEG